MNYLVTFDVAPELLDRNANNKYKEMITLIEDYLLSRDDVKITENTWAVKARRQRTTARHIKYFLLDKTLKDVHYDVKNKLRLFVTPIHAANHSYKDPACDTERGVRGYLEWFVTNQ